MDLVLYYMYCLQYTSRSRVTFSALWTLPLTPTTENLHLFLLYALPIQVVEAMAAFSGMYLLLSLSYVCLWQLLGKDFFGDYSFGSTKFSNQNGGTAHSISCSDYHSSAGPLQVVVAEAQCEAQNHVHTHRPIIAPHTCSLHARRLYRISSEWCPEIHTCVGWRREPNAKR